MFLILIPLPWGSRARRNQPHVVAAPDIDDYQDPTNLVPTQSDPALFVLRKGVLYRQREIVLENGRGFGKVNSMLGKVLPGLDWILFITHGLNSHS
jgi:hypothetical protein